MTEWAEKISDLESAGRSLSQIALAIGVPPSTVSEIKQGRTKNPRYNLGEAILREHAAIFGPAPVKSAKPKRKAA